MEFEHTDGLNYINTEIRRFDNLLSLKNLEIGLTEGIGAGIVIPKTNVRLFNQARHDDFHLSGYGFSAILGVNFTFFKYFFIQTEAKAGFINMPDIRTTFSKTDKANQHFLFVQSNAVFGFNVPFFKEKR